MRSIRSDIQRTYAKCLLAQCNSPPLDAATKPTENRARNTEARLSVFVRPDVRSVARLIKINYLRCAWWRGTGSDGEGEGWGGRGVGRGHASGTRPLLDSLVSDEPVSRRTPLRLPTLFSPPFFRPEKILSYVNRGDGNRPRRFTTTSIRRIEIRRLKNNNRGVDSASGKTNLESPWFGLRNNDATARHPRYDARFERREDDAM